MKLSPIFVVFFALSGMVVTDFVLSTSFAPPFCAEATSQRHYALACNDAIERVVTEHAERVGREYGVWKLSVEASKQPDEAIDEMMM